MNALKERKPDLLHNFTVKCAVYGAIAARTGESARGGQRGRRNGVRVHQRTSRPRDATTDGQLADARDAGSGNSRVILQNPDDADAFVRAGLVPSRPIRVIRSSGVDISRFYHPTMHAPPGRCACCWPRACCGKKASVNSSRQRDS